MEALKKRGEEEEEHPPGQALTQAHPATCNQGTQRQFQSGPAAGRRRVVSPAETGMGQI